MKSKVLIEALKKKFGVKYDTDLSKAIGISASTISKWQSNSSNLTPQQICDLVCKSSKHEVNKTINAAIQPIVEFYPIEHEASRNDINWELLPSKSGKEKKIRQELESSKGIYIFYNSQCQAIYLGKTKGQNLWKEMNLAFNRDRNNAQSVLTVKHPERGKSFIPAHKMLRNIVKTKLFLYDIASFFSVYKIDVDLIDNLEALMIRGFANNLSNVRMEKFQ